jgi:TRAP-type C4-dicarboxylate transport system permease small subunit
LTSIARRFELVINWFVVLVGAAFSFLVLFQVVARYFLDLPVFFASALSNYLFIWYAMAGAALAMKEGLHVSIDLLPRYLGGFWHVAVRTLAHTVSLLFLCLLIYASFDAMPAALRNYNPALGASVIWGVLAIPVGAALTAFFALAAVSELFLQRGKLKDR